MHKCFDSYISHSITAFPEGSFIRDLCLIRGDYPVFDNCAVCNYKRNNSINVIPVLLLNIEWKQT